MGGASGGPLDDGDRDDCDRASTSAAAATASAEVIVTNSQGLHLRPATEFARVALATGCAISVHYGGAEGNGTSVLELAMMAILPGAQLRIQADGEGCEAAVAALVDLVKRDFQS